jgi:hypothetical protein
MFTSSSLPLYLTNEAKSCNVNRNNLDGDVHMQYADIFEMGTYQRGVEMTKLPRTQTVSLRLDPKLRYLSEIGARRQRRTLSSFIEWAIENSLDNVNLTDSYGNTNRVGQIASKLWHVEPADRFAKLALHYPDLLTHQEEIVWKLIQENGVFWRGNRVGTKGEWTWTTTDESDVVLDRLREHWETVNAVARGELSKDNLPTWVKYKPPTPKPEQF